VVSLATAGVPDTEVQVRRLGRALARRADGAEPLPGRDLLALAHSHARQVQVGGVEAPVGGAHGDGQSGGACDAGEADRSGGGGNDRRPRRTGDVDPAMLTSRIGIRSVAV
jgi:hypothetical protein